VVKVTGANARPRPRWSTWTPAGEHIHRCRSSTARLHESSGSSELLMRKSEWDSVPSSDLRPPASRSTTHTTAETWADSPRRARADSSTWRPEVATSSTSRSRRSTEQEGPNQNPLLVDEITGMRRGRTGHPGHNGPVAIRLLAATQNRVARSAPVAIQRISVQPRCATICQCYAVGRSRCRTNQRVAPEATLRR
jgi:hypothetical protein